MPEQAPNISWVQKNAKWLCGLAVVGVALAFVLDKVNPDTIAAFQVKEAITETKREIRWCLVKQSVSGAATTMKIMECAD